MKDKRVWSPLEFTLDTRTQTEASDALGGTSKYTSTLANKKMIVLPYLGWINSNHVSL